MDLVCFNCGKEGHFYFECVGIDSVDGKFRKQSIKAHLNKNPSVNFRNRKRQLNREDMKREGYLVQLPLIMDQIERKIDTLTLMKQLLGESKIKIYVFQRVINQQFFVMMRESLEVILPDIVMLTCYAVSHLIHHVDMNYLEKQVLWGKKRDLRDLRDEVAKIINSALGSVDKFYLFMENRNGDLHQTSRTENQVDLKTFVINISKITDHVEIIGAENDGYWDSGTGHNIQRYLV